MANNEAIVTTQGRTFRVDREELAENMQRHQLVSRRLGLRPGEPTGDLYPPNNSLSSDVLAVCVTIIYNGRKPV